MSQGDPNIESLVRGSFTVRDSFQLPDGEVEYKVAYGEGSKDSFRELRLKLDQTGYVPWLYGTPDDATLLVRKKPTTKRPGSRIPVLLLLLTLTSIIVFALLEQFIYSQMAPQISGYVVVIAYSSSIIAILAAYEFGHRYASERARIEPPIPYFIPGVPFNVTAYVPALGVLPAQRGAAVNKDSVFDVSIAGPLAALAVALVLLAVGEFAWVQSAVAVQGGQFSNSLINVKQIGPVAFQYLLDALTSPFTRSVPAGYAKLSPIGDAAYAGLFLVFLNLLPISRLDGGNMFSVIFGERAMRVGTYLSVLVLIAVDAPNYWAMGILVLLLAGRPTNLQVLDEVSPPSKGKRVILLVAIVVAFLCLPLPGNFAFVPLS